MSGDSFVVTKAMVLLRTGVLQRLANARQFCLRCAIRQGQAVCVPRPITRTLGEPRLLSTANVLRSGPSEQVEATV